VTKLNPNNGTSGITLAYSTCLGGTGPDAAYAIAVDGNGAAYVAGSTQSTDFPVSNAYQAAAGGGGDAFVAKLNPAGSSLTYSTYLGGSGNDQAKAIAVDSTGAAYVAGRTNSPYFPTSNAWQGSFAGGTYDAFVSKLNPNTGTGNVTLAWSTYLGGSAQDEANAIALDSSGAVYVAGATWSTDFPLSSAYPASVSLGPCHAFVTSFNPYSGSGSLGVAYSTYFGGPRTTVLTGSRWIPRMRSTWPARPVPTTSRYSTPTRAGAAEPGRPLCRSSCRTLFPPHRPPPRRVRLRR